MYTPGTILRLAREERKLSIPEVKHFAKIRESAIAAMENDDFERFPAAYMQTFLPSYADFLGVPQYQLAEAFKATLPEYQYLARSLYSRTLQQIAVAQMQAEYEQKNPAFTQRVRAFSQKYASRLIVLFVACVLGWSIMTSDVSLIGTLFVPKIVSTPSDLRGTPFTELSGSGLQSDNREKNSEQNTSKNAEKNTEKNTEKSSEEASNNAMQTVHLASLFSIDAEAIKRVALKNGAEISYNVGEALIHAADDLTPAEPKRTHENAQYDASHRSISSIAASMLHRIDEEKIAAQEPLLITEAAVEQHRGFRQPEGKILVVGVEDSDVQQRKPRHTSSQAPSVDNTSSVNAARIAIDFVELKNVELQPLEIAVPKLAPSEWYLRHVQDLMRYRSDNQQVNLQTNMEVP